MKKNSSRKTTTIKYWPDRIEEFNGVPGSRSRANIKK